MPKQEKTRSSAFRAANRQAGFREYAMHAHAKQFGHAWMGVHLDSMTIQKVATRAFLAVQQYALAKRGRPRFRGHGSFDSVEGKSNSTGIRWRANRISWFGLELSALIDQTDQVIAHGLASPIKFVRLVRRKFNGHNRFFAQLVCEGQPFLKVKHKLGRGVVGLDIGPSTIAVVSRHVAKLERFCDELESKQATIRRLQRKLDRQRRANNPDNFNPNGTPIKGKKLWKDSNGYLDTRRQLAEIRRQEAAHRKSLHGRLVHRILMQGNIIKTEKLSYRSFQKMYGRSLSFPVPRLFVAHLRRKAANAGAEVYEFNTPTTRLSQTCLCGATEKKPLSLRWHVCECGVGPTQRDLFSAWLACFVTDDRLDAGQAQVAWPGEDERLRAASRAIQAAMGQGS